MQSCKECNSVNLREDYNDGSLVCTNCGLIASHFLFDDRPFMDENRHIHYEERTTLTDEILKALEDRIPINTLQIAEESYMELSSHKYDKMVLRCACVYHAWKKTKAGGEICHLDDICRMFLVSKSKVIDVYSRHFTEDEMPDSRSKYHGFSFLIAYDRVRSKVLSTCVELERILSIHPHTANKKPTKMCAAIFYHCCKSNGIVDVSINDICKYAEVSMTTFKKHFKMIECVQNCKNT